MQISSTFSSNSLKLNKKCPKHKKLDETKEIAIIISNKYICVWVWMGVVGCVCEREREEAD